jgi:hypothetical protein
MLFGVLAYEARLFSPRVIFTVPGDQSVNAFTGPADHSRQEVQWQ